MKDLRDLCADLGWSNPRTVGASGNLVFKTSSQEPTALSGRLEEALVERFALRRKSFVYTAQEFRTILQADPIDPQGKDGSQLTVMFLDQAPTPEQVATFRQSHSGPEQVEFGERAAYIFFAEGMGRSKLDLTSYVGAATTVRNRNTLARLSALLES